VYVLFDCLSEDGDADFAAENAVNLATVAIGLNNPYNLEDFDDKRQGLMNALVASAPRQVAP
jgi:telomere length regulation protein